MNFKHTHTHYNREWLVIHFQLYKEAWKLFIDNYSLYSVTKEQMLLFKFNTNIVQSNFLLQIYFAIIANK